MNLHPYNIYTSCYENYYKRKFIYSVKPPYIHFRCARAFMAGAASQAEDADSPRAPGLTSGFQGSVNVQRGALLLVPQWQYISSFVFYIKEKKKIGNLFRKEGRGRGVLFHMTLGTAMLKWQCQRAVKVFSVSLVILKNKIMYFWLDLKI